MTHDVPNDVVIGNQEITFTDAFYELAAAVKKAPLFRVILPKWIFKSLTIIFKIELILGGGIAYNIPILIIIPTVLHILIIQWHLSNVNVCYR